MELTLPPASTICAKLGYSPSRLTLENKRVQDIERDFFKSLVGSVKGAGDPGCLPEEHHLTEKENRSIF